MNKQLQESIKQALIEDFNKMGPVEKFFDRLITLTIFGGLVFGLIIIVGLLVSN